MHLNIPRYTAIYRDIPRLFVDMVFENGAGWEHPDGFFHWIRDHTKHLTMLKENTLMFYS